MKKIMFNDKYELTKAVLNGRKTQTRRIINPQPTLNDMSGITWKGCSYGINSYPPTDKGSCYNFIKTLKYDKYHRGYKVGEIVAVAQCYRDMYTPAKIDENGNSYQIGTAISGWTDKRKICAEGCIRRIRIKSIRVERLQDISDEDCIKEGIKHSYIGYYCEGISCKDWEIESHVDTEDGCTWKLFPTPKDAYSVLIDKISGKGTWDSNPYVFVYDFELIK